MAESEVDTDDRVDPTDADPEETVALYVRVSTEDQSLNRQQ